MTDPVEQIAKQARALSAQQRATLAELLLASLDEPAGVVPRAQAQSADSDSDPAAHWDQELRERIARFERGETTTYQAAEVFAEARRRMER